MEPSQAVHRWIVHCKSEAADRAQKGEVCGLPMAMTKEYENSNLQDRECVKKFGGGVEVLSLYMAFFTLKSIRNQ